MGRLVRRPGRREHEAGFSLVELLVVSALVAVALPLGGALLHSAVVSQRDVTSVTEAGTRAQTAVSSLEVGIRNAAAIRYTRSGADNADELLVVRARTGSATASAWVCRAWFYAAAEDVLYTRATPADGTAAPIAAPTSTPPAGWSGVATGVVPRTGAGLLTPTPDLRRVDVEISAATGTERPPAAISTSITPRPQGQTKGAPCF